MSDNIYKIKSPFLNKMENFFSLLKLDFNLFGKQIFLAPIIVNIVFIFIVLFKIISAILFPFYSRITSSMNIILYYIVSLIIGIILSSNSLKHIHSEEKAISFFMLPKTQFEKFASIWLYYVFFYLIVSIVTTAIAFIINSLFISFFTKTVLNISEISKLFNYQVISTYFFLCSIFILGSSYFKKNSFFKTILTILAISFIYSTIIFIITYFSFRNSYYNFNINIYSILEKFGINFKTYKILSEIIKIALAIFFYFLSYLRIVEYDVKGE